MPPPDRLDGLPAELWHDAFAGQSERLCGSSRPQGKLGLPFEDPRQ
jgi:hypothetical protein